ncbi:hypothetical protein PIB30_010215 [Stylosanthes scabra]|uniref:Uncharacterized protein n=1 Tax=Stylosanthes scabra TaxID=79078 RepID=A0ABU6S5L0_9FABA|nr:hypothetical protein [Stylosanthes scabra]
MVMMMDDQLGPQQPKYMTVRRDSSACLVFWELEDLMEDESKDEDENRLACFEEEEQHAESLRDFKKREWGSSKEHAATGSDGGKWKQPAQDVAISPSFGRTMGPILWVTDTCRFHAII